ncbi:MAG: ABC transporter permease [Clostridiales bacterium]|nr:ABC transporter permease [Clostridiales bacterium]
MILRKRDRLTDTGTGFPYISVTVLTVIVAGCIIGSIVYSDSAYYMQLSEISAAPGRGHIFGTDTLGRDLFSVIWCGGRISLTVGLLATLISTAIAVVYGAAAGLASQRVDDMMMRLTEILMSVPQMLFVMFLQAIMGDANVISISVVIGITGWMAVAKMVRSEVRQLRSSGFVMAARSMGGGFFYILYRHLMPNFMSAVMFMIVTNIGGAISMEATLSFLGLGLPAEVVSWGSLMSLSQRAMLSGAWWILMIPGIFMVSTLICITEIGEYLRCRGRRDRLM